MDVAQRVTEVAAHAREQLGLMEHRMEIRTHDGLTIAVVGPGVTPELAAETLRGHMVRAHRRRRTVAC